MLPVHSTENRDTDQPITLAAITRLSCLLESYANISRVAFSTAKQNHLQRLFSYKCLRFFWATWFWAKPFLFKYCIYSYWCSRSASCSFSAKQRSHLTKQLNRWLILSRLASLSRYFSLSRSVGSAPLTYSLTHSLEAYLQNLSFMRFCWLELLLISGFSLTLSFFESLETRVASSLLPKSFGSVFTRTGFLASLFLVISKSPSSCFLLVPR